MGSLYRRPLGFEGGAVAFEVVCLGTGTVGEGSWWRGGLPGELAFDFVDGLGSHIFGFLKEVFVFLQGFSGRTNELLGDFPALFGSQEDGTDNTEYQTEHEGGEGVVVVHKGVCMVMGGFG